MSTPDWPALSEAAMHAGMADPILHHLATEDVEDLIGRIDPDGVFFDYLRRHSDLFMADPMRAVVALRAWEAQAVAYREYLTGHVRLDLDDGPLVLAIADVHAAGCNSTCWTASKDVCVCRCGGKQHGIATVLVERTIPTPRGETGLRGGTRRK